MNILINLYNNQNILFSKFKIKNVNNTFVFQSKNY